MPSLGAVGSGRHGPERLEVSLAIDGPYVDHVAAGVACQVVCHWSHVSGPTDSPNVHGIQSPSSIEISTEAIPRFGDHATPATAATPAGTSAPDRGTSILDMVFIGPSFDQPSGTQ